MSELQKKDDYNYRTKIGRSSLTSLLGEYRHFHTCQSRVVLLRLTPDPMRISTHHPTRHIFSHSLSISVVQCIR